MLSISEIAYELDFTDPRTDKILQKKGRTDTADLPEPERIKIHATFIPKKPSFHTIGPMRNNSIFVRVNSLNQHSQAKKMSHKDRNAVISHKTKKSRYRHIEPRYIDHHRLARRLLVERTFTSLFQALRDRARKWKYFSYFGGKCVADGMSDPDDVTQWQAENVSAEAINMTPFYELIENTRPQKTSILKNSMHWWLQAARDPCLSSTSDGSPPEVR